MPGAITCKNMLGTKPGSHTTSVLRGDGELGAKVAQKL
jgi:hypothetical protein